MLKEKMKPGETLLENKIHKSKADTSTTKL